MTIARVGPGFEVWGTVAESYALTFSNLGYLLRISWAWAALMIPLSLGYYASIFWFELPDSLFIDVLSTLLLQPFVASIAVAWHRRLLVNEVWSGRIYLRLDRLVASYIGLVLIINEGPSIAFNAMVRSFDIGRDGRLILVLAIGLPAVVLGTKIGLALPARALGNSDAVRQGWRGSRGNVWRLMAGFALCSLPMPVLDVMVWPASSEASQPLTYAGWQTLYIGIAFLFGMPIVSFLSLAYRRLIQDRNPADLTALNMTIC